MRHNYLAATVVAEAWVRRNHNLFVSTVAEEEWVPWEHRNLIVATAADAEVETPGNHNLIDETAEASAPNSATWPRNLVDVTAFAVARFATTHSLFDAAGAAPTTTRYALDWRLPAW